MLFPLTFRPKDSYKEGMRRFNANRDHGRRKHAGCDLYAPIGTPVFAVADGTVIGAYPFYLGSWAIEVDHGSFVVRYGEVKPKVAKGIKAGASVTARQLLGEVGLLKGLKMSMLHFEMYAGTEKGALTVKGNPPFQRRKDLIDPTPFLDAADSQVGKPPSPCFWFPRAQPGEFGIAAGQFGFTNGM
jgi:murein DD-endopeptidase MepM/ murein hydrolase activator NlpD